MKNIFKRIGAFLLVLAIVICPAFAAAKSIFAEAPAEESSDYITVRYFVGDMEFTKDKWEKSEDGTATGQITTAHYAQSGKVFMGWVLKDSEASPIYQSGLSATFSQDTDLEACYLESASGSENIYAVKDGKTEYHVVYNGKHQVVPFDVTQKDNTYKQERLNYSDDDVTGRFYLFDYNFAFVAGADWYVDFTNLSASGKDVGTYFTYPQIGAEWVQTWGLTYNTFTPVEGKYCQIDQGVLYIDPRPITVATADVEVRFGDVIPTEGNTISGTDAEESGVAENDKLGFAEITAEKVGKGQKNTYTLEGKDGVTKAGNYKVEGENLGTLDVYYEVTFDLNGGTGNFEAIKVFEDKVTLPKETPAKGSTRFLGWVTSKDASKVEYKAGEEIELDGNVTLYAVWESPATGDSNITMLWTALAAFAVLTATVVIPRRKTN